MRGTNKSRKTQGNRRKLKSQIRWNNGIIKLREELKFNCPICGITIRYVGLSNMVKKCHLGEMTKEAVLEHLKNSHVRHVHTHYDKLILETCKDFKSRGYSYDLAKTEAKRIVRSIINPMVNELRDKHKI